MLDLALPIHHDISLNIFLKRFYKIFDPTVNMSIKYLLMISETLIANLGVNQDNI